MKIKISGSAWVFLAILVLTGAVVFVSFGFPVRARLLPIAFAGTMFILSAIGLGRELLQKQEPPAMVSAECEEEPPTRQKYFIPAAWIFGFTFGIYLIGLLAAIFLVTLFYVKFHGGRWFTALFTAVIIIGIIYYVFHYFIMIDLYPGLILSLLSE